MRRAFLVLVAGTVLVGAGAPIATAAPNDGPAKSYLLPEPLKGPATAKDWAEFFEAVGDLQATLAGFEADKLATVQRWRYHRCQFQSLNDPLWTAREERLTARCVTRRWSIPGGLSELLAVGQCESGWDRFANNAGRYLGLFQHAASSWAGRVRSYGPARWHLSSRWTNSRTQIVVTARMARANGWGAWSCA